MVHQKEQSHPVKLDKVGKPSFGICIVRGEVKDSPSSKVSGIFIKDIVPQSPAHQCGKLKVGDRILTLNNRDIRNATESQVIDLIRQAGQTIDLEIQTFGQNDRNENERNEPSAQKSLVRQLTENKAQMARQQTINRNDAPLQQQNQQNNQFNRQSTKTKAPQPQLFRQETLGKPIKFDYDDDDDQDEAGRMITEKGYEIDRASAGNITLSAKEAAEEKEAPDDFGYTLLKIRKKYGRYAEKDGKVHRIEIQRPPNADLGLALAGHRDRLSMGTFVAGINPKGLFKDKDIHAGDEVLEVNGHVLRQRSHLNATATFKNVLGDKIVVVVLRRKNFEGVLSVKPVKHFKEIVDETEWLFNSPLYKNVKKIQIQKTGVCIGVMIVEGKHVEVGNGIFISDLMAGSLAELGGFKVGDLVLAVNKDVFVETTYDQAVDIIKRAKGVITFVICSLKSEDQIKKEKEEEEKKRLEEEERKKKPADPFTDPILENRKNNCEFKPEKKPLGIIVAGGKNGFVKTGAVITHIFPDGVIGKDNRLQVFDQILTINETSLLPAAFNAPSHLSNLKVRQLFTLYYDKLTMNIWRNNPAEIETVNVDVMKKPGKEFGLSLAANNKGACITDIQLGNYPEIDKNMQRGDVISKLNGDSLQDTTMEVIYAAFKTATGKCSFEILRPKPAEDRK